MNTIGSRIKSLRTSLKLRQADIASKIGVSAVAVGNWERGENEPSGSNLLDLARTLNTSADFLITGENGRMTIVEFKKPTEPTIHRVPLISAVQAGQWKEAMDHFHPGDADEWRETTATVSNHAFALKVEGRSMHNPHGSPSIPHGSIVIVDPEIAAINGKIVVAKLPSTNEVTIKRLVIDGSDTYLEPLNPDYKPILIDSECMIVGVVKQVIQDI